MMNGRKKAWHRVVGEREVKNRNFLDVEHHAEQRLNYSSTSCCDIALIDQIIKDFIADTLKQRDRNEHFIYGY